MFVCKYCGITKNAAEYRIHARGYRIGRCRQCERDYQREWSRRNPDEYRAKKRATMASKRAANPEAVRVYQRELHKRNRARNLVKMRDYYRRRFFWARAMKLRGKDRATHRELAALWHEQRGKCALTGRRLDRSAQLDHVVPQAKGGVDRITNLRWVCEQVNIAKRDMMDDEFAALCSDVMRWIGERIALVESVIAEMEAA